MRKQVLAVTIGVLLILSFFSVLQFWQIKPVQAVALPFSDGLESGDTANFDSITETGGGNVSVESSVKYAGTYAANLSSSAQDGVGSLNTVVNSKVIVAQYMFNIQSPITTGTCGIIEFTGTDSLGFWLAYVEFFGEWRWRIDLGGGAGWPNNFSIGFTMSSSNWYQFTIVYNVTGQFFNSYVNDTLLYAFTSLTDIGNITSVKFRANPISGTGTCISIFDNIAVDDDAILSNLIDDTVYFAGFWIDKVQKGQAVNIAIKWTQDSRSATSLDTSIFSWNSTGPYVNTTGSLSGHEAWHNFTETNNSTEFTVVGIKLYCNNTLDTWTTKEFAFTTMNDTMMLHNINGVLEDETGKAIYLRGTGHIHGYTDDAAGGWIRLNGLIADSYSNDYNETAILENLKFMSVWGIDHIRFHVNTAWWEVGNITDDGHTVDVRYAIKRLSVLAAQYGLYLMMENFDLDITNSTGFCNWWGNVTTELRNCSNLIFEIRNEPSPANSGERDAWMQTMQNVIERIRETGASNPIVLMGSLTTVPNSVLGWTSSMEWALPIHYNFTDFINDNLVLSGHLYRTWMNPCWFGDWNYTTLYVHMEDTYFREVQQTTHRPVIVGEIGCNMWEDNVVIQSSGMTNQTMEATWAYNVFVYCNNFSLGYSAWNWIPSGGDQWYEHSSVAFEPSKWGLALIRGINYQKPFVWTAGAATGIYSNTTTWSSTWASNQLTVTYTGATQVRVFWNVSNTYLMNSSLYCYNSNGTYVLATDFYDATTNLIRLNSTNSGTWTIGYTFPSGIEVITIVNTWWYGWW